MAIDVHTHIVPADFPAYAGRAGAQRWPQMQGCDHPGHKTVVIGDKLGIAAEMEAEMQHVVNTYECEWKKAINDPQTLKRFRHFVNSEQTDDNVIFVPERDQIRPANIEERQRTRAARLETTAEETA